MKLSYQHFVFHCRAADRPYIFKNIPGFVLHSVLGKELHGKACFHPGAQCEPCADRFICPYGRMFVTFMRKDENALAGCNRATHPFVMWCDAPLYRQVHAFRIHLILPEHAVQFFPYFVYSLTNAGNDGLFKARIRFLIENVTCRETELVQNNLLQNWRPQPLHTFELGNEPGQPVEVDQQIMIQSPLRIKYEGRLQRELQAVPFLRAVQRRSNQFCALYGSLEQPQDLVDLAQVELTPLDFDPPGWEDYTFRSVRQQQQLKLGGIRGAYRLSGKLPRGLLQMLELGEVLHIGKNIGFGLGKYRLVRG